MLGKEKLFLGISTLLLGMAAWAGNSRIRYEKGCTMVDQTKNKIFSIHYDVEPSQDCKDSKPMYDLDCRQSLNNVELADAAECVTMNPRFLVGDEIIITDNGRKVRMLHSAVKSMAFDCNFVPTPHEEYFCNRFEMSNYTTSNPRIRDPDLIKQD